MLRTLIPFVRENHCPNLGVSMPTRGRESEIDRTANTSNIPAQETDARLLQRRERLLRLPERHVNPLDRLLERRELHHRIRYLPRPQRIQALIEPSIPLLRHDPAPPLAETVRVRRQRRLHPHLDGLERTQGHVGEELGARGRGEVDERLVGGGEECLAVEVLERFVEAVFAASLQAVADERGAGAEEDALEPLLGDDGAPGGEVGRVDLRVDLTPAFDLDEGSGVEPNGHWGREMGILSRVG